MQRPRKPLPGESFHCAYEPGDRQRRMQDQWRAEARHLARPSTLVIEPDDAKT